VEDTDSDFYVIQLALKQANIAIQVCRVTDGVEAIEFLERSGSFEGAPRPHMILLNLHMPRKNGFELLEYLREHESFRSIPAVMFTTATDARDRKRALSLGAREFLVKHYDLTTLLDELACVCAHYLSGSHERAASRDGHGRASSAEA
jgi:CheY-like chemotaxis protein